MAAVALDQKSSQELVLKAVKYRKRSGCFDRQQVKSIDRNLFFFKATHFQAMTTVNEDNTDKTKVPDEFIFRIVLLVCFTAELDK